MNNEKKMNMPEQKQASLPASPDPLLQFVFAMFAILTWLSTIRQMTPDAAFVMGVLQISLGIAAFTGSILNLQKGDPHGNINLVLAVILGFAAGLTQLASVYAKMNDLSFHPWILSVILLMGGLYMLAFLPLLKDKPLYIWLEHLCVSLGFLCNSFADICSVPVLKVVGAWLLFAFALFALYQGVSQMYVAFGKMIPQGPKSPFASR